MKKKGGLTLELYQKGGVMAQSKIIQALFAKHRQVSTRIPFILPHIHGGASLFIPHKLYP